MYLVLQCMNKDDLSFRDVICFEVWRAAHVSICNRPAFVLYSIFTCDGSFYIYLKENKQDNKQVYVVYNRVIDRPET